MNKTLMKTYQHGTESHLSHSDFSLKSENNNEIGSEREVKKVWSNYPFGTASLPTNMHILEASWAINEKPPTPPLPVIETKHEEDEIETKEEESTPSHYARRPMNAFLIFCKKHRPIVRERFPNLENRGVTRILGEWWALLDDRDKSPYTNLAKEYKDAFLCANPDFKWYKLPAPPLRSLTVKTTNISRIQSHNPCINKSEFTPGKLADESQLGGLTSLMNDFSTHHVKSFENNNNIEPDHEFDSKEATENFQKFVVRNFWEDGLEHHESSMTKQDIMDKVVDKIFTEKVDDEQLTEVRKSGRQCKGKRYEKFMVESRLLGSKRDSKSMPQRFALEKELIGASKISNDQTTPNLDNTIKRLAERTNMQNVIVEENPTPALSSNSCESSETKFDLNQRIDNLPSLSYDAFYQKKKDSKKRKNKIRNEECKSKVLKIDQPLTGSKKRKNKQSITHLKGDNIECNLLALETLAEIAANTEKINSE